MADHRPSPRLRRDEEDQLDNDELEDIINEDEDEDEDLGGEGAVEEGDKPDEDDEDAQEGLELDMPEEEDGMGYDDDPGFHDEDARDGVIGYQHDFYAEKVHEPDRGGLDVDVSAENVKRRGSDDHHDNLNNQQPDKLPIPQDESLQNQAQLQFNEQNPSRDDPLSRPPHGSEVFVGGISKDTHEDDLRELCSSCGEVFEVRLMKDNIKGDNKGFAFITFTSKESAERAIETLNGQELKGRKLRFSSSQAKNKLFIGNVPKNWSKEEFQQNLLEKAPGITNLELLMPDHKCLSCDRLPDDDITLSKFIESKETKWLSSTAGLSLQDPQNTERNRGFAFVEYYNHACAENARRALTMPGFKLGNNVPTVNWADSRGSPESAAMSQVKVVYVRNLPESATEEKIQELFGPHGEISKVVLPQAKPGQPKRDFGFIHYVDRSAALKAIEKTHKYELDGRELEVSLAKPASEKRPGPMYPPFGVGVMPQLYPSRVGYGQPSPEMYGVVGPGLVFPGGRGQPVIYGRGPAPAGMAMVPMILPDGRMGYVFQQPGLQGMPAPHKDNRVAGRGSQRHSGASSSGSGSSRRYRPY